MKGAVLFGVWGREGAEDLCAAVATLPSMAGGTPLPFMALPSSVRWRGRAALLLPGASLPFRGGTTPP